MRTLLFLVLALPLCAENLLVNQGGTSLPANTWTRLTGWNGPTPTFNGYDKMAYVPYLRAACGLLTGYRSIGTEPNRSYVCFSFEQNRWDISDSNSTWHDDMQPDGGHVEGSADVDQTTSTFYGLCCMSGSQGSDAARHTWWYDFTAQAGRDKQPATGKPLAPTGNKPSIQMMLPSGAYDSIQGLMVMWDGEGGKSGINTYDPSTNTWNIAVTTSGTAPNNGLIEGSMTQNSADGKLYLFGGLVSSTYQNAVYSYQSSTATWAVVSSNCTVSSNCPAPRIAAGWAYDRNDNVFLMYGGCGPVATGGPCSGGVNIFSDTWVFDPIAATWTQLSASSGINESINIYERLVYMPEQDVFLYAAAINGQSQTPSVWAFRYRPGGNYGFNQPTYSISSGSLNRNIDGHPTEAIGGNSAGNGSSVLQGWSETGSPTDPGSACAYYHPYAQQDASGTVTILGSACTSMSNNSWNSSTTGQDGVGNGTTTFSSMGADFTTGCNRGSCAGQPILIDGLGQAIISSVTDAHDVILPVTVPTATGLHWIVPASSGATPFESADVSVASIGSTPWACWHQQGNSSFGLDELLCMGYSGGSWSLGGLIGRASPGSMAVFQGNNQITNVNGIPAVIFREQLRDTVPYHVYAYVKQFVSGAWTTLGGALNLTGNKRFISLADSVSIASDGTHPFAAWTEYTSASAGSPLRMTDSAPQVYLSYWSGSAWTQPCSGSANVISNDSAYSVSVTYMGGQPFVAFQERSQAGYAKLYVRTCSGGVWTTVGGAALNRDPYNGWAFAPSLTNDGKNLYVSWSEQGNQTTWLSNVLYNGSFGQHPHLYVAKWAHRSWKLLGGTANMDSEYGAATHSSLVIVEGAPTLLWGETKPGTLRQMYAKRWNGTDWISISGARPTL